jgi:hypothetical protein
MRKLVVLALVCLAACADRASALEIRKIRAANGMLGAKRDQPVFLPGDFIILVFDIEGLDLDPKTGVARFRQGMQITGPDGKDIFAHAPPAVEVPLFGAKRLPSYVQAFLPPAQAKGIYTVKIKVKDERSKETKEVDYKFKILDPRFGLVQPLIPAVGFVGQGIQISFAVVGMKRDAKKLPDVEITTQLLNKDKEPLVKDALTLNIRDLHAPPNNDLTKELVVPLSMPLVLSQAGTFYIQIRAKDKLGKGPASEYALELPLTVLDASPYLKKMEDGPPVKKGQ